MQFSRSGQNIGDKAECARQQLQLASAYLRLKLSCCCQPPTITTYSALNASQLLITTHPSAQIHGIWYISCEQNIAF